MTVKEFIISRVQLFFYLVTLILAAEAVVGAILAPDQRLGYIDLLDPIITAGLCIIPTLVTYFKNEPTVKQYIIRLVIQLVLIEAVMLTVARPKAQPNVSELSSTIMLGLITFVIYVSAVAVMGWRNYIQSKKLTAELKALQADSACD